MKHESAGAAHSPATPEVLYEDESVLVINKPAGLLVHDDGRGAEATVVAWFLSRVPTAYGVGEPGWQPDGSPLERSGVVHRLDADTSGVMILAKQQAAHRYLKAQFTARTIEKWYYSLVYGWMRARWGSFTWPIGRHATHRTRWSASRGARGTKRDAHTEWQVAAAGVYEGERFSALWLAPRTGRTHQLRVHCQAAQHPIVGDTLYAPTQVAHSCNLGLERLALHAYSIRCTLPNESRHTFRAPMPPLLTAATRRIAPDAIAW